MRDMMGKLIGDGDRVAYPVRVGSETYMQVIQIEDTLGCVRCDRGEYSGNHDLQPKVVGKIVATSRKYSEGSIGKRVTITATDRLVLVAA